MKMLTELEAKIAQYSVEANEAIDQVFLNLTQEYLGLLGQMYGSLSKGGQLTWSQLSKYGRLRKFMKQFESKTTGAYKSILKEIRNSNRNVFLEQRIYDIYDTKIQSAIEMGFDIPSENVLNKLLNNPIDKMKLPNVLAQHRSEIVREIQKTITQGAIKGDSYEKTAQEISKKVGISATKARRVVRTENGRARTMATLESDKQLRKAGISVNKYWLATLDSRVRASHAALDGRKADEDGYFHSGGHKAKGPRMFGVPSEDINCRCHVLRGLPKYRTSRNYNDPKYQKKLAKRITELIKHEDLSKGEAEKRAKREVVAPNKKIEYVTYNEWRKDFIKDNKELYKENIKK